VGLGAWPRLQLSLSPAGSLQRHLQLVPGAGHGGQAGVAQRELGAAVLALLSASAASRRPGSACKAGQTSGQTPKMSGQAPAVKRGSQATRPRQTAPPRLGALALPMCPSRIGMQAASKEHAHKRGPSRQWMPCTAASSCGLMASRARRPLAWTPTTAPRGRSTERSNTCTLRLGLQGAAGGACTARCTCTGTNERSSAAVGCSEGSAHVGDPTLPTLHTWQPRWRRQQPARRAHHQSLPRPHAPGMAGGLGGRVHRDKRASLTQPTQLPKGCSGTNCRRMLVPPCALVHAWILLQGRARYAPWTRCQSCRGPWSGYSALGAGRCHGRGQGRL
jgi:hypothetical protein